jgi:hypothetical protein
MQKQSYVAPFVFGLILGILCTIFLPKYVRPYIPESIMGKTVVVKGTVVAKQKKENTLLLTVNTPQGALLATFDKKVDETNLLINEQDTIEFSLPKYLPFIDDPKIIRVVKEQQAAPELAGSSAEPAVKSAKEMKQQRGKPLTAVPAARSLRP